MFFRCFREVIFTFSLFLCGCAIGLRSPNLHSQAHGVWRVQEGDWTSSSSQSLPTFIHADPYQKGGLLGQSEERYGNLTFAAAIQITTGPLDAKSWAGLIIAARSPVAEGAWGPGCLVMLYRDGRLKIVDIRDDSKSEFVSINADPTRIPVRVRIETRDTSLTVFINGYPSLDFQARAGPLFGEIGIANYGCTALFSEVFVSGTSARRQAKTKRVPTVEVMPKLPYARVVPLPRISALRTPGREGRLFCRETGDVFHPRGFNYTVIGNWWHAIFNTGIYDPAAAERELEAMRRAGANCIRVWAWGEQDGGKGSIGPPQSYGLNPAYLENFSDFLRRATRQRLYVIAVLDELPLNARYLSKLERTRSNDSGLRITGHNRQFLARECIEAKAEEIKDFLKYIKAADPGLLNTVLAWEFANEAFANTSEGPFLQERGRVKLFNGKHYNMADFKQRQACWDDGIALYARKMSRAVHEIDPGALTTIGFWTADAHQRSPINGLIHDSRDPRVPPRPSALAHRSAGLSFLDIHCYPFGDRVSLDPAVHERLAVLKTGIPVIVGEFGVFEQPYIDQEKACALACGLFTALRKFGYQGGLFWTWNLCAGSGTWCAQRLGLRFNPE